MDQIRNKSLDGILSGRAIPVLFTLTIFLSASLLFFVQPLFAKIALPQIGGAPAVWTTAMLFFQTVLIAGYAYAHFSTRYLPVVGQMGLHIALWAVALFFLPLSIRTGVSFDADTPVALQTLLLFAAGVGVPFAVLSANAPLIQSWYAKTGGPSAHDPYFLYGASNLGSLGALLAFPLVAEPLLGASQIGVLWAVGFVVLGGFLFTSGMAARRGGVNQSVENEPRTARPGLRTTAYWLFLAFIPSSLMLSVTAKISRDIGSFPLIWVVPLAIYLLTFVLTFTNRPFFGKNALRWMLVCGMAFFCYFLTTTSNILTWETVGLLLASFFGITMMAHAALYAARPDKSQLTYFYMMMSIGGALGGLFNSIIAPTIFDDLYETRIIIFLALALFLVGGRKWKIRDLTIDVIVAAIVVMPLAGVALGFWGGDISVGYRISAALIAFAIVVTNVIRRPVILSAVAALAIGSAYSTGDAVFKDRSFFGTHRVIELNDMRIYVNGSTMHGAQFIADFEKPRPAPLNYYHAAGPMGQVMASDFSLNATDIGIVGLGVGSLACYAQPGQNWQFYEIDALVDEVARDSSLFTFVSNCAPDAPTHLGDARVVLEQQKDLRYDVLVIDAFSSDAIPVHLTTKEAMTLFQDRLKPGGLLVLHISNRYYNMSVPMARVAEEIGMHARYQEFANEDKLPGATSSKVVLMSADADSLAPFDADERWRVLESDDEPAWTDEYANILSVMR
ncbi:fused MFS/spermidine synthase [Yoonia sp. SDW83-1]|uniref:fused MFS/spermidine synthase n=1 Tax=Yoonia sp. SDW83-1 TaxID=3366945 RepID=UPI00398C463F